MTRQTVSIGEVIFEPQSSGRELIKLGAVQIGEIMPNDNIRSRFKVTFRLRLPESQAWTWRPAYDAADARRRAELHISDWLEAIAR